MSFVAQLTRPNTLTMDWYQRHPALQRVTIHVDGLNAEDVPEAGLPQPIRDLLLQLDAAIAAYVEDVSGVACAPQAAITEPVEANAETP